MKKFILLSFSLFIIFSFSIALFSYENNDPNINSNFLIPTAETNDVGSFFISDYQLLYLNLGYTPVENLNVTVGFLAPLHYEIIEDSPYSLGFKYQFVDEKDYNFSIMGSVTEFDMFNSRSSILYTIGFAGNIYSDNNNIKLDYSLNALIPSFSTFNNDFYDNNNNFDVNPFEFYNVGLALSGRISRNAKVMLEVNIVKFDISRTMTTGLLGLRFSGENFSLDIAGVILLEPIYDEDFLIAPFLNVSYHF